MLHSVLSLSGPDELFSNFGLWAFLSIGAVSLFGVFIPLTSWIDSRRREREAYYKAETFRRIAESSAEGAKAAIAMLREEDRLKQIRRLEGMKIGGLINVCVGIGLVIFLRVLIGGGPGSPFLCGLIPMMVGAAMLVYVFFLAKPVE